MIEQCCGEKTYIRTGQDPSHYGKYEVELEVEIPGYIESIKGALESAGYVLGDFDQWGLTQLRQQKNILGFFQIFQFAVPRY